MKMKLAVNFDVGFKKPARSKRGRCSYRVLLLISTFLVGLSSANPFIVEEHQEEQNSDILFSSPEFSLPTLSFVQSENGVNDKPQGNVAIVTASPDEELSTGIRLTRAAAAAASSSALFLCPRRCTCEKLATGGNSNIPANQHQQLLSSPLPLPNVLCSRQNLTRIPEGIPGDTRKLDLSWNNLTSILASSLNHLGNLHELSLKGNELGIVGESAFSNLTKLRELILAKNKVEVVPPSEALPSSLEILDLEHNKIERLEDPILTKNGKLQALLLGHNLIEFIGDDAFEALTSLTILELNDNKLTSVPDALAKLPTLQELSLANNRITRIEIPFHETIPKTVLLQVRGNPIHYIHPEGFSHLHHLKKLILSDVKNLTDFPQLNGTNSLEVLRIDRCSLQIVPDDLCVFTPNLKSLDLKSNLLRRLPHLSQCAELRILDLGQNEIEEVEENSLKSLGLLHDLHLPRNKLTKVEADTFRGLGNLQNLDLSYNFIEDIDPKAFLHVRQLKDLNLGNNLFPELPTAGLDRLIELKTFNNPNLREFPGPENFPSVRRLVLSYAYHCCQFMAGLKGSNIPALVPPPLSPSSGGTIEESIWYPTDNQFGNALDGLNLSSIWPGIVNLSNRAELANDFWKNFETDIPTGSPADSDGLGIGSDDIFMVRVRPPRPNEISCRPLPGPFLPCTDLFDWWTLRCGVWIVFLLALMGNGTVVFVLIFARTKMDVPRFLVCNLAVADFFMGVYLGFLAVVDAATLGEFRRFAIPWQLSSACQMAGFLGVLSSELSVFTLAVITMERHYAITHAMHLNKRLSLRHASYIMVVGWIFALIMAILPLFGISDYRKFAVCLPFETEDPISLGYVVFLMFANGVAFTILMGCYLKMYCSIRGSQAWNSNDTRIAKRMALLVFTDLLCWFPIAFFSLTAIFGLQLVSLEEAKVFTVFILPLNSCCNPFLYAILTKQFKKDCVLICKAIEESRVTRGIGRCRHSSNFSNRQTAPNTGSLTEKSSKDGQPCICNSGLHPNGGDVNGNAKYRFIKSPERLRSMGPVGRFFSKYVLCHDPSKEATRQREEDYRMRNVRRYLYNNAQTNYPPTGTEKHQRHASVSSDNFSSSRSDSWRVQNRCGIPLRMIEPRRRNSWAVTRKPSQDSNLSSSRNDSSATSNSTATWRLSRSSVSSDAASHSGGGKSSFKRISQGPGGNGNMSAPSAVVSANNAILSGGRPKLTMPTSTAAVAAAAAAAAVATGSAAAAEISVGAAAAAAAAAAMHNPLILNSTAAEDEVAALTMTNTIQNQIGIGMSPQLIQKRASLAAAAVASAGGASGGIITSPTAATGPLGSPLLPPAIKTKKAADDGTGTSGKKRKKKRVKIKKPPKKEVTVIRPAPSEIHPEIDNDEIDDEEELSAKIATNRPRLVRQSAFFSDEVVIEPEVCPVHGPLNPGTYDDEDDEDEEVSDLDEIDEEDDDDDDEDDDVEEATAGNSHHSHHGDEDEEEDIEDPTSPILRRSGVGSGGASIAGIALVIVPRRLSTVRGSRDELLNIEQSQPFIRASGSSNSINNGSPSSGGISIPIHSPTGAVGSGAQSSTNSPTALLLPAGMAHFGRRKMSEQPVKFYVVPATTGLLTSAKWHSMSHVDGGGGTSPPSPNQQRHGVSSGTGYPQSPSPTTLRSQTQHSRSHSPRQFPRHEFNIPGASGAGNRRLSSSIAETVEEAPTSDKDSTSKRLTYQLVPPAEEQPTIFMDPLQRPQFRENLALNEQRRVSFQLPGINLPSTSQQSSISPTNSSPPERILPLSSQNQQQNPNGSRRGSNS